MAPKKLTNDDINLEYIVMKAVNEVIEQFSADVPVKEQTIRAADFINALKFIADVKGLKVVPDNTFKGEQDIDLDEETDS